LTKNLEESFDQNNKQKVIKKSFQNQPSTQTFINKIPVQTFWTKFSAQSYLRKNYREKVLRKSYRELFDNTGTFYICWIRLIILHSRLVCLSIKKSRDHWFKKAPCKRKHSHMTAVAHQHVGMAVWPDGAGLGRRKALRD
jgi:hypothetical protein